tara:strand:- start:59 stop:490 length:432 start_codon:yes stop_codon:yes gene_type:complete
MTNFNTEIHEKVSQLSQLTVTYLNEDILKIVTLAQERVGSRQRVSRSFKREAMVGLLTGSKVLFETVGSMLTTESRQSNVIKNLLSSLEFTFKACERNKIVFDSSEELLNSWNAGLKWALKQEGRNPNDDITSKQVLNLFDNE